ncbi:hypothetical protein ACHAXT_001328 [Thalassiosira profunda]
MAVQPLLRRFVAGLAAQIPPGRLRAMAASSSASDAHSDAQGAGDGAGDDAGGALRLFLEKAAESLPMGSRVRTAVGEDFERALELLREEIEGRVAREVQGDGPVADGGSDGDAAPTQRGSGEGYPLMAFSRGQHDRARAAALEDGDDRTLQLLLCAPHAAPFDFIGEGAAASDAAAVLRSLRNALLSGKDGVEMLDYGVVVAKFIEALSSEEDVPSTLQSIRQLLSCLAAIDAIPDEAASSIGELVGCYAAQLSCQLSTTTDASIKTTNSVVNAISVALASFSGDSAEVAAEFVRGYLRGTGELTDSKAISAAARALASLVAALGANGTLKGGLPVMPKMKKSSSKVEKGVRSQLLIWRSWADGILGAEEEEEEVAEENAGEAVEHEEETDGKLMTLPEESELAASELAEGLDAGAPSAVVEEAVPCRRSTRKRKQSDGGDSVASAPRRSTRARGNSESESDAGGSATGELRRSSRRKAPDAN